MADLTEKLKMLSDQIGQEYVKTDADTLAKYAIDNMTPRAVIFPKNTKETAEVVQLANREKLTIVPWGSGSRIKMGPAPTRLDLVVCTRRLNHMIDVDTQNLTITVEAGVRLRDIQARLATEEDRCYLPLEEIGAVADEVICSDRSNSGCFLPLDPSGSDSATIGGIIAANASGPRRLLYNLPRDLILGVRFVTPQGDVPGSGGKTVKNVSGFDVSKLMVGSMGSLGIITEMTFRLLPLPEKMESLLVAFDSFAATCDFVKRIFETPFLPAAVETMNAGAFESLNFKGAPDFNPGRYNVAISLEAFEPAVDRMKLEMFKTAEANNATSMAAFSEHEHLQFWLAVSRLPSALDAKYAGLVSAKVNCRITEWKAIFEFAEKTLSDANIPHALQAHSGSGVCLLHLLFEQSDDKALLFMEDLLNLSRKAGGNTVVQNAPTDLKGKLKIWGETGTDFIAMKRLKAHLDPNGVMSPGRYVGGL